MLNNLVILLMPYYRILVWTRRRKLPFSGIRLLDNQNINAVYNMAASKARATYRNDFIEVEVQMLSKLCPAVKHYAKVVQKNEYR